MNTRCPLPIDWLDFVETGQPDSLAAHLDDCASCRAYVDALRTQARGDSLGDWLDSVALEDAVVWRTRPATSFAFGSLAMNASDYDGEDASYHDLWRLPFVVLDDGREIRGRRWYKVAPVDTDSENASSTDLLLQPEESDLGVPMRVVFSLQTSLAEEQLSDELGRLTAAGEKTLRQALAGELDEMRYGLPLTGPEDDRLAVDRELDEVARVLRSPFFALEPEPAVDYTPRVAASQESLGQEKARIFSLNLDWLHVGKGQLALAAAQSETAPSTLRVWLNEEDVAIEGQLRYELRPRDLLLFFIDRFDGDASSMQLVVHTKSGQVKPSPWFKPQAGEEFPVAPVFLPDVDQVEVQVR